MSVHVVSWVLKHSEARLGDRLVLLVLADHARGDGTESRPSVKTIAAEARLSERQVQYSLRSLEAEGSISKTSAGLLKPFVYTVLMGGVQNLHRVQNLQGAESAGGAESGHLRVKPTAPEPSTKPSKVVRAKNALTTTAAEKRIFEYAATTLGHDWKFTSDRRTKIRARLRDGYSEADLIRVIDGVLLDPWEKRRERGNDDPTLIFRDGTHVDKFLELANGSAGSDPDAQKEARQNAQWAKVTAAARAAEERRRGASTQ